MPFFKVLIFWYNKGVFRKRMRLVNYKERPSNSEENDGYWSCWRQEKAMRARSILNRRAQTTGSTCDFWNKSHKFVQINFAQIKKNTTNVVFFSGAADQTWTGDLILTKDVLYRLSHSSVFINAQLLYWIRRNMSNEMSNKTKSRKNNLLRRL